ncbi:hypothetical protein M758_7G018700, partial [Ceratodon purpureus]
LDFCDVTTHPAIFVVHIGQFSKPEMHLKQKLSCPHALSDNDDALVLHMLQSLPVVPSDACVFPEMPVLTLDCD